MRVGWMNKPLDMPSFYAGIFVVLLALTIGILSLRTIGDYYTIAVPEICDYEEDNCYPEYSEDGWRIVEGER